MINVQFLMMNMINKIIPKMAERHKYDSPTASPWGKKATPWKNNN